jgi:WD40 repeat protein
VVRLREVASGSVTRLVDHTASVDCLAIAPDSSKLASGAADGKVRIHGRDGRLRRTFARLGGEVLALAWRGDHELVCGTSEGRVVLLRDLGDGPVHELHRLAGAVHSLAVHEGGLALGCDGEVVVMPLGPR